MNSELQRLLETVFDSRIPADIEAFFDDRHVWGREKVVNSLLDRRDAMREANRARMIEQVELTKTLDRLTRRRAELAGLLAGSTVGREPVEVGGWMAEVSGADRVIEDTRARIAQLSEPDARAAALATLINVADALMTPGIDGPIEVDEATFHLLPERVRSRVDTGAWERKKREAEARQVERQAEEARRIEAERTAADELAGRLAEVEGIRLDDIIEQLFPDPHHRHAVVTVFKSAILPEQYSGRILIENLFNQVGIIRRAEPVKWAMIARLRDAASRGLRTDLPEPAGAIRLTPAMMA